MQVTAARRLAVAPYSFTLTDIGLYSLADFIGALVAMFFGGRLIDRISNTMTERSHGRREAEYRLPGLIVPAINGPMGILIFGLCLAHKVPWIGSAFRFGMQGFGLTAASNVLVTYAVDPYLPFAGEALVIVFLIRGVSGCLLPLYCYDWIVAAGMSNTFGQMAAVQYFLILIGIVFAYYGKHIRNWTASYSPLEHVSSYQRLFVVGG